MLPIPEKKYRLMAPGPVMMPPSVYKALSAPMIHHRTQEFADKLEWVLKELPRVFGTTQPVMMLSSTGTGGMEAALVNTLSPGDRILCLVTGKFGQRWGEIASAFGIHVDTIEVPWGEPVTLDEIEASLKSVKYNAMVCQASETSTGTWLPIREIGALVQEVCPDTMFIVDGITAVGASDLHMDDWKIDVVVAGSQKAFMLPTGLSFVCLSEKAWKKNEAAKCPRFYFDLKAELKANKIQQTYFSSNVSIISALYEVLRMWQGDQLQIHRQWYRQQQELVVEAIQDLGLSLFSKVPSPTVTAINVPEGIDGARLRNLLEEKYQLTLMGGQEHLKGKIIRIGHMGDVSKDDIYACIYFLIEGLRELGHVIEKPTVEQTLVKLRNRLGI